MFIKRYNDLIRLPCFISDIYCIRVPTCPYLDAVPESRREDASEYVEVEEEGEPRGRLVLGHRRDDRDVDLGVTGVPQRVEFESEIV